MFSYKSNKTQEKLYNHIYIYRHIYQWIIGIAMGTNCVPLLVDFGLFSYDTEFVLLLQKIKSLFSRSYILAMFRQLIIQTLPTTFHYKNWRYWRGNQKLKSKKDRQYNGQEDNLWSTKHYPVNYRSRNMNTTENRRLL